MDAQTTHASLLEDLRRGRPAAWPEFQARYGELIRSFGRRRGLQPSDCDDVLQNVLLALTKSMPGFEYDPARGKFRSYLKTVTVREVTRIRQKPDHAPLHPDMEAAGDNRIDEAWDDEWTQYHVRRALATIETNVNRAHLDAYYLCELDRKSARTVAELLGTTENAVYQSCSRIRKKLKAVFEAQVLEEG